MKVIGKDRTSCDVCNPFDEIIARLDALEKRASAIVAKVQGLAPDGEGNVTLPTSSSDTDPLHGRVDAFAMSSEVKEAADDAHAYAASIADDVVVISSEIDALNQVVDALQKTVSTLESIVTTYGTRLTAVEDADAQNVKLSGNQNITGIKTVPTSATGVRDTQIANGTRIQNDLDNYAPMARLSDYQVFDGIKVFDGIPGATNARNSTIDVTNPPSNEIIVGQWVALDKNNQEIVKILAVITPTGSAYANILVRNANGTYKAVRLATGD